MNTSFEVTLSEAEYIKTAALINTPPAATWINARLVGVLLIVAAICGPFVFLRQGSMSLLPFLPVGLFAGFLVFFRYGIPARMKTLYSQQQDLHQPLHIDITDEAIQVSNPFGHSTRPWSMFIKWLEDDEFIVLYLTDVQIYVLPKSQMGDDETCEAVRSSLSAARVPLARRSNIYAILSFFVLLWLGLLLSVELGVFRSYP